MRTPVKDIARHSLQEPVIRDQTRHDTSDSQSCLFRVTPLRVIRVLGYPLCHTNPWSTPWQWSCATCVV